MWGYQQHFRSNLNWRATEVFQALGVSFAPDVHLIGIRLPQELTRHPVCIEPEDGGLPLSLFASLHASFEEIEHKHPLQNMFYGDEPSERDKPENIRRSAVTMAVEECFVAYDAAHACRSFCGPSTCVDGYYIVPVIQLPTEVFEKFKLLLLPPHDDEIFPTGEQSLLHSTLGVLLNEAAKELRGKEPSRGVSGELRTAAEMIAEAAKRFMRIPDLLTGDGFPAGDLFQQLNVVSSLFYEGAKSFGKLFLVNPERKEVQYLVRFRTAIPLDQPRWARKILQKASEEMTLICSAGKVHGLGKLASAPATPGFQSFVVRFLDHYQWELNENDRPLMYSRYREAKLPDEPISRDQFVSNFCRILQGASAEDAAHMWSLFNASLKQEHGSMLVIAEDAPEEAARLSDQGTAITPVRMTTELLARVSGIDGSIIVDPQGVCHAIGVILDGEAVREGSPARGSRFNSARRYVQTHHKRRLAIVVSDDRTVDVLPLLRAQLRRSDVEKNVAALNLATLENYHAPRSWLDAHRFYLSGPQCATANQALDRIENLPTVMRQIVILTRRFVPDAEMNDSYFLPSE